METPDVTLAQKIAVALGGVPQLLVLFDVNLSAAQEGALDKLLVLAGSIIAGDAVIRVGRAVGRKGPIAARHEHYGENGPREVE